MSGQPNLIVVGASARSAAFSALRAGMRPYTIDLFADSDLADLCPTVKVERYPHDFERALAEGPQAPWIYTGGLENYPELVGRMSRVRPLHGNGPEVLRQVRNPRLLAQCLADTKFQVPEICNRPPRNDSTKSWLRKPRRSSGGLGIRKVALGDSFDEKESAYYQEYIAGETTSAVFVAAQGGCELLGMTTQQCGVAELSEEPFLYRGSTASGSEFNAVSDEYQLSLQDLGTKLVQAFGLGGLFNVDLADRFYLLEVNPRYSASVEVLEQARDKDFLTLHRRQFEPDFDEPRLCRISRAPRHAGKRVVYATGDCVVGPEIARLRRAWNEEALLPNLADIPRPGDHLSRGQPVATVLAEGGSEAEVEQLLAAREAALRESLGNGAGKNRPLTLAISAAKPPGL